MIYINLLIIFLLIITIHEFGHYLAARLFKAKVTDFSIGFGKSIYQYTDKNNTCWKISMIPLGGYVKIKGLDAIFQNNNINKERGTFQSLSLIKKIIILLAGSFFNLISAWFCLFMFMLVIGISTYPNIVGKVLDGSPASVSDIREGDVINIVNSKIINKFSDIGLALKNKEFATIQLTRDNLIITKEIKLQYNLELDKFVIGISSNNMPINQKFNFNESLNKSFFFIPNYYISTFQYMTKSISNNTITKELSGPIGIVKMADQLMLDKIQGVLFLFIVISLFVAIFNLLPIPLLDGGHILYFIILNLFSESLPNIVTRLYIVIGLTFISFLFFIVTFNDIFYK